MILPDLEAGLSSGAGDEVCGRGPHYGFEKQRAKWCYLIGRKVTYLLYRLVWTEHESMKFAAFMEWRIFHFNEFGLMTEGHLW